MFKNFSCLLLIMLLTSCDLMGLTWKSYFKKEKEKVYSDSINLPIRTPFDVTIQNNQKIIYFNVSKEDFKEQPYQTFSINFYYKEHETKEKKIELMDACTRMQSAYQLYVEDKSLNNFEKLQQEIPALRIDQFVLMDLILEQQQDNNWQIIKRYKNIITNSRWWSIGSDRLGIKDIYLNPGSYRVTIINRNPATFYGDFDQDIEIAKISRSKH